ncbi:O-methyltransferase [Corynebacterium sp. sy039]|uniref:O-methyltransferase n=1 Tax=Corynebacterium sp. sy039 TaxID=2599641 RepID=UPI0011B7FB5D|nr:class I SAM-dependent methyltransferase [Corynebacterium sp. sy039]QDZ42337.1 O-methyltransferase [Corynebacterium sp. sy039]
MSNTSASLNDYIEHVTVLSEALSAAQEAAHEFGLITPDAATGKLLSTLATASNAQAAIAVSPAASVVGLYLLEGLNDHAVLSCIDPEPEHQKQAKTAFAQAGYPASRIRFLPSRPLDVMSRLATASYDIIYADISALEFTAFIKAGLPLLAPGGTLILADCLLDGTISDVSRKDRETISAREAEEYIASLDNVLVTRLPLGSGMTLISKKR